MNSTINNPLILAAVGMITVFFILLLVVLTGKTLITIVNRWFSEPETKTLRNVLRGQAVRPPPLQAGPQATSSSYLPKAKLAAIVAAVDMWTLGQGHIKSIRYLKSETTDYS